MDRKIIKSEDDNTTQEQVVEDDNTTREQVVEKVSSDSGSGNESTS